MSYQASQLFYQYLRCRVFFLPSIAMDDKDAMEELCEQFEYSFVDLPDLVSNGALTPASTL